MAMAFFESKPWPWVSLKASHVHGFLSKQAMAMSFFESKPWPWLSLKASSSD
jgi:hypothetical protein